MALTTLATAAPITVPVTPRKDAATVAVIAASAVASSCVADSSKRGRSRMMCPSFPAA
jgi:hypothetical protein